MRANNFDYAVIRVVPRVDRGEFLNAGVILFCRPQRFLAAVVELDEARLAALAPGADLVEIQRHLDLIPAICRGGAGSGPIGALSQAERFHWLVSPRSSVIQTSPVHCGLADDLEAALRDVVARLVVVGA